MQVRKIDEYHKSRGFGISSKNYFVGYHYLIEANGLVVQTREDTEIGAHDAGENLDSIGVCLAGDFNVSMPTAPQTDAFAKLLRKLIFTHNISLNAIEPHRRDDSTDCPGKLMPDNFPLGLL